MLIFKILWIAAKTVAFVRRIWQDPASLYVILGILVLLIAYHFIGTKFFDQADAPKKVTS